MLRPRRRQNFKSEFAAPHLLLGGADLSNLESTRKTMAAIAMRCGGIDVLVNVAGGFRWEKLEDGEIDTWDQLYAMNLRTAVISSKCALPAMLERGAGRIINIGAGAAAKAGAGMGAYAASKAGVQKLTEALSEEIKGPRHHGECGAARHHRHAPQSTGHADRGFLEVGATGGDRRGDRVPGLAVRLVRSPAPRFPSSVAARRAGTL